MKVKELIAALQELESHEQDMPVSFRVYDKVENDYYFIEISGLYGELLITTTHPIYDYYEYMPEDLRDDVDGDLAVEGIVLE